MAKFFDNMTGKQKLILIFGGIVLAVAVQVLFPEAYSALITSIMDAIGAIAQAARDFGGNP